jgi:CHAT domain-containing protein
MAANEKALEGTLNAWLQWKGAVMEAQGKHIESIVASGNTEIKAQYEELTRVRREIAKLQTTWRPDISFAETGKTLAEYEAHKETLEAKLSSLSRAFATDKQSGKADTETISRLLPDKTVYLDFARISFFNFEKKTWEKPRYFVFVLRKDEKPALALIDLGPAEAIDRHINDYLKAMASSRSGYVPRKKVLDSESVELHKLLLRPLAQFLVDRDHLFISPDGNLNLIPFEILLDEKDVYPIESAQISYISAGRDIVRFENDETPYKTGMALILADPDYDLGLTKEEIKQSQSPEIEPAASDSKAYELTYFTRLPHTVQEANTIQQIIADRMHFSVQNFQDTQAVEAVLNAAESPSIMHLATHGYFIARNESMGSTKVMEPSLMSLRNNPMLRSGIVLTGVNLSLREGRDEGIMSAAKVMGLRLTGTDLVVLSACETGLGDVQSGEGVFGLKRAFILSGAKAVVLSLWSVPSKETMELMTTFYSLIADGKSKAEALRQAKLTMLKNKENPFFWGAFVLVGNPE